MKLVFLGTSAAQPTERRGLSCICLEKEGEILMFDAGEAAQIAYMKSGLGWNKKMKLFYYSSISKRYYKTISVLV